MRPPRRCPRSTRLANTLSEPAGPTGGRRPTVGPDRHLPQETPQKREARRACSTGSHPRTPGEGAPGRTSGLPSAPTRARTWDPRLRRPMLYPAELWALGRGERIRTSGILLPKQARYQAALRPDWLRNILQPPRLVNPGLALHARRPASPASPRTTARTACPRCDRAFFSAGLSSADVTCPASVSVQKWGS